MKVSLEKYLYWIVVLLTFLSGMLFLATAFNSFYWMDDFWKRYELINTGFFQFQWNIYWQWDGRAISPVYTIRDLVLWVVDYPNAWAATLVSMGFLIATSFYLLKILTLGNWDQLNFTKKWLFTLLITFILVLVFRPHLSRSLYWATGSFYIYANFFSIFLAYRLLNKPESKWNWFWIFTAVSSGPNNGIMLMAFLFLGYFFKLITLTPKQFYFLFLIGLCALILVVMAPGNFNRANGKMVFSLLGMLSGGVYVLREYIGLSVWTLPGSLIIALGIYPHSNGIRLVTPLLLLICALCSIIPFLPMPGAASKHTALFFQTFVLIGLSQVLIYLVDQFPQKIPLWFVKPTIICFLIFFGYQMRTQWITGRVIKTQIDKRFWKLIAERTKIWFLSQF